MRAGSNVTGRNIPQLQAISSTASHFSDYNVNTRFGGLLFLFLLYLLGRHLDLFRILAIEKVDINRFSGSDFRDAGMALWDGGERFKF